jgi:uncharacterized DUF497 family protein
MLIQFDPKKSQRNEVKRKLPFARVIDFSWDQAVIIEDDRYDYPEVRFVAIGFRDGRLHVLCFNTCRGQNLHHLIQQFGRGDHEGGSLHKLGKHSSTATQLFHVFKHGEVVTICLGLGE